MTIHAMRVSTAALIAFAPMTAASQWVTTYDQFYLQAKHNWVFRDRYVGADRLFNAFDYGHAILYEILWTKPNADPSVLEQTRYRYLVEKVLVSPPRVPLEEAAIEVNYAKLAPEAKVMFEWAHILHRQLYDVLADERLDDAQKDAAVARLVAYYKSRPDVAFSSRPKSMKLMQEQPYSLAFRQRYPKFNGLIWAYHWMQVGLYEPLVIGRNSEERQALVRATVARFWQMLGDPPRTFPYQMPMTAAIAPHFTARFQEAAIIFDNLHSMHDVISDILANASVPRERKRAEILRAVRLFRDDTSYVVPVAAWRTMAKHMGVENMGGPSVGFVAALPMPTVTYGAVMTHDDRTGEMIGFAYGSATGGEHAEHEAPTDSVRPSVPDSVATVDDHAAMHGDEQTHRLMELQMRMLSDSVIRRRAMADTTLRRMLGELLADMPAEHSEHLRSVMSDTLPVRGTSPPRRPTGGATTPRKPVTPPADPHAGHVMPAKKPPAKPVATP